MLKWVSFAVMGLLVILALDQQIRRTYWDYYPFEPMKVHGKIQVDNLGKIVHPGGQVIMSVSFDKNMDVLPVITSQLYNGVVITLAPIYPSEKRLGKNLKHSVSFEMPIFAPTGKYVMVRTWTYRVGPTERKIHVTAESEPFYVVENQPKTGPKGDTGATGKQGVHGEKGENGKNFFGR